MSFDAAENKNFSSIQSNCVEELVHNHMVTKVMDFFYKGFLPTKPDKSRQFRQTAINDVQTRKSDRPIINLKRLKPTTTCNRMVPSINVLISSG